MTTKTYDHYASSRLSLEEARRAIEAVLDIEFRLHDSLHLGGDYFRAGELGGEEFVLRPNHDEDEDDPLEPGYPTSAILLDVNATTRADELRERLERVPGLEFLNRSVI